MKKENKLTINKIQLGIQEKLQKLNLNKVMMDSDATSLYPSAMCDEKTVYPKIETGFAFKLHTNNQTFKQDGNESAILKIKYYNPSNLMFQHLPVKQKVFSTRNGYTFDTLTSVDICEIIKMGGKVIEMDEGVIYRENFKISPFGKVIEKCLL